MVFLCGAWGLAQIPPEPKPPLGPLQRLYIANEGSDSVSVIDLSGQRLPGKPKLLRTTHLTIIPNVPTGSRPHNVNVDPEGKYFYVTNYQDNVVQIFSVWTNALIATVPVGHQPAHVVPDPTRKLIYVSNEGGTTLSTISIPDFIVTETLELKGQGPHGHVISRDGQVLLTPNSRSGDVSVVDLSGHRKIDLIKLPPGAKPVAMGITRNGEFAFVTDAGLNQVHKIDVAKEVVLASLSVGKRPIQTPVHPTRPFLYIPCMESGDLYKVDIDNWSVEKVIPLGRGPHGIAYSADGRYAYVTLTWEKPEGRVAVVDTETDTVQRSFPVGDSPNGIAVLFGKNQGW